MIYSVAPKSSASTSLEVNSAYVAIVIKFQVPQVVVLQTCTLTSGLLLAGGLLFSQVNTPEFSGNTSVLEMVLICLIKIHE